MIILDIEQNSPGWLSLRDSKITSSDSSIINGTNPFCKPLELYKRKLGMLPPIESNERMRRGHDLESPARDILNQMTGHAFKPYVGLHDVEDWCMTSLDGLSACGRYIAEIKAPNDNCHNLALRGKLKPYYECQIYHHLFVSGAEKCYYFSYSPEHDNPTALIEVIPDEEYIENLIELEREFYQEHLCVMNPPTEWVFNKRKRK